MLKRSSEARIAARRPITISRTHILLALLVVLGACLYLQHSFRFFLHDDEGNYAYAAWRISAGEVPYRDFLTPQMPLFLYWGGLIVHLFGRSFVALRVATLAATLLAAYLLYALNRQVFGRPVAIVSMGLFLIEPNVFHGARFFLPEAYMLVFQLAGLYAFVLGEKRRRLGYYALAGALFGLSMLSKLFGALSLAGCFLYLLYAWWRERRSLAEVVREGLALGLPALLVAGAVALLFTSITPYFATAVFKHHTMQGAGMSMADRVRKGLELYRRFASEQRLAMVLAASGACLALWRRKALASLLLWQIPTASAFLLVSREVLLRHLTYLAPALVTLIAVALVELLSAQRLLPPLKRPWQALASAPIMLAVALLTLVMARPWMVRHSVDTGMVEDGSSRLAALIQSLTTSDEQVMSDYPGLNFLAGRRSTYWAGGMSGGAASSGQINASKLIADLEQNDVAAVLINISGHDPQMALMGDYGELRRYVQQHYVLAERFEYTFFEYTHMRKALEVYARRDPVPLRPNLVYQNEVMLQAVRLSDAALASGSTLTVDVRWQGLGQARRDYHASALLVDADGRQWAETHGRLQNPQGSSTSAWFSGEVAWARYRLQLNPAMPPGDYHLVLLPYYPGSGFVQPSGEATGPTVAGLPAIATVRIVPGEELPAEKPVTNIRYPLTGISFGDHYDLLGYDLSTSEMAPGETVRVTLFWAYRHPSTIDYKVFVHLLDGASQMQGQHDAVPAGGGAMTSGWVQGDVLVDRFEPALEPTAPKGTLQIEVGFYDLATGERLPLLRDGEPAGEDRLILPTPISVR